jgi:hypothetical protein
MERRTWKVHSTGVLEGLKSMKLFTIFTILLVLSTGCVQTRLTEPKRSAIEQLLISTAADRALDRSALMSLAERKVFVDAAYYESEDKLYVIGSVRDVLSQSGALLVPERGQADLIVEPRSGALSIDSTESIVGLPSIPVAIPFAGAVQTPEVFIFKSERQFSTAKLALLAYERESGRHVHSSGPLVGRANLRYYRFLGYVNLTRTDIPEK